MSWDRPETSSSSNATGPDARRGEPRRATTSPFQTSEPPLALVALTVVSRMTGSSACSSWAAANASPTRASEFRSRGRPRRRPRPTNRATTAKRTIVAAPAMNVSLCRRLAAAPAEVVRSSSARTPSGPATGRPCTRYVRPPTRTSELRPSIPAASSPANRPPNTRPARRGASVTPVSRAMSARSADVSGTRATTCPRAPFGPRRVTLRTRLGAAGGRRRCPGSTTNNEIRPSCRVKRRNAL